MVTHWSAWHKGWEPDNATPYAHWWAAVDSDLPVNRQGFDTVRVSPYDYYNTHIRPVAKPPGKKPTAALEVIKQGYGDVPIPSHCKNRDWPDDNDKDWITEEVLTSLPDDVPREAVIVGVVDTGIALGHRAFRLPDGGSRIIAAWQQTAKWAADEHGGGQDFLPFGRELYARDIERMIAGHTYAGRLDEDAFNRAARLVEPEYPRGQRDLDFRAAHGTHVLDLAAGALDDPEFARRVRIILVNLPAQSLHGSAGNFLEFFAAFAIARIESLADALWAKQFPDEESSAFPVAVNFSYVMQAGPHNGARPLELMLRKMIRRRGRYKPLSINVPIGNSNLNRGFARLENLQPDPGVDKVPEPLAWRLQPADMTSNFVEIWTDPERPAYDPIRPEDFTLWITPPGMAPMRLPPPVDGGYCDLGGFARVYARFVKYENEAELENAHCSTQFVICTSPTTVYSSDLPEGATAPPQAPAGTWTIRLSCRRPVDVSAYVQSDQASSRGRKNGLQSYFDDPAYRPWRDDLPAGITPTRYGYGRDSFAQPYVNLAASDLEAGQMPVLRRGTGNALTSSFYVNSIAGYRLTDGAPALYSATPRPRFERKESDIQVMPIQMAYPTDEGPAHPGVLASGARDGTSVNFRGTSMASAMATRQVALAMLRWRDQRNIGRNPAWPGGAKALQKLAAAAERRRPEHYEDAAPLKIGAGRMPYPKGIRPFRQPRRP